MATKAKRPSKKKASARRGGAKKRATSKRGGKKMVAKSARKRGTTRAAPKRSSTSRSPLERAKRVAREVVEQATVAVTTGVETLKDLGEDLAERVRPGTTTD